MSEARTHASGPGPTIVQVVRRFGPVGGMESYVWHLSHELATLGQPVIVLCEVQAAAPVHPGVQVVALGRQGPGRPRWWALLRFARAVRLRLREPDLRGAVVHSHERCTGHDISTFHSDPFCAGQPPRGLQILSPRHWIHRWMERRELGLEGRAVRVVPVSARVSQLLSQAYPALGERLEHPIAPGVHPPRTPIQGRACQADGGVVGFMGREWKRKGLPLALRIVAQLRRRRPQLQLQVLGPPPQEVERLCRRAGVPAQCLGWRDPDPHFAGIDLLLHPARSEAYGMVIAEAVARGVPVVASDRCGAADDLGPHDGTVVPLEASLDEWVRVCESWLAGQPRASGETLRTGLRSWREVALDYLALYRRLPPTRA